jgi:hypothetical protein
MLFFSCPFAATTGDKRQRLEHRCLVTLDGVGETLD